MCIIAVKPRGKEVPSDSILRQMFTRNPDGAGIMYASLEHKVVISKGFMTFDDFHAEVERIKSITDTVEVPMVFHFRIKTHGVKDETNTHPFPISDKVEHLKALDVTAPIGVAHNGIINSVDATDDLSDTMVYIKDVLSPLKSLAKYLNKGEKFIDKYEGLIKATIGVSRLAFLEGDGTVTMLGSFVEDNGIYYSNSTYKTYTAPITTYYTSPNYASDDSACQTYSYKALPSITVKYRLNEEGEKFYPHHKGKVLTHTMYGSTYPNYASHAILTVYSDDTDNSSKTESSLYIAFKFLEKIEEASKKTEDVINGTVAQNSSALEPIEKVKNRLGGKKCKDTENLLQTANYTKYFVVPAHNKVLKEIPVGYVLFSIEDDIIDNYNSTHSVIPRVTITEKNLFYVDTDGLILFRKGGMFYLLEEVDAISKSTDLEDFVDFDNIKTPKYKFKKAKLLVLKEDMKGEINNVK